MSHTYYMRSAFEKRAALIQSGIDYLKDLQSCDCIVIRGTSGAVFGPMLAFAANRELAVIRKDKDDGHAGKWVESPAHVKNYLIVDDFVDSGATVFHIVAAMRKEHPDAQCVGVFQYERTKHFSQAEVIALVKNYQEIHSDTARKIRNQY